MIHDAVTELATENWDAPATANLHKVAALVFAGYVPANPVVESKHRLFATFDCKTQIYFGNLSAARAHHFTSSL